MKNGPSEYLIKNDAFYEKHLDSNNTSYSTNQTRIFVMIDVERTWKNSKTIRKLLISQHPRNARLS